MELHIQNKRQVVEGVADAGKDSSQDGDDEQGEEPPRKGG
jgi:hypothetical protein